MSDELKINGQPLSKLVFNVDNFLRLKDAYQEVLELLVIQQAKNNVEVTKPAVKRTVKVEK